MIITDIAAFHSGTPQFRISESSDAGAPVYAFYSQADLENDLTGVPDSSSAKKCVRTFDAVKTVSTGDVVFSLLSGTAAIAHIEHNGYLITQNYVVIAPSGDIDPRYLVYLLNENRQIRHQLRISQQGSITMKYTLVQVKALTMPPLPSRERQELIGETYLNQLRLEALRKRTAKLETTIMLEAIRKAEQSWEN